METLTARKWYRWLWLSPIFTLPTYIFLFILDVGNRPIAVIGSAVWHLILLIPALNKENMFVRWHGRQALLLAGVRTFIPLMFAILDRNLCLVISILIIIWIVGTRWAEAQAARGDCSLLRWINHGDARTILESAKEEAEQLEVRKQVKALVGIIRFSRSSKQRSKALSELEQLEMVEPL